MIANPESSPALGDSGLDSGFAPWTGQRVQGAPRNDRGMERPRASALRHEQNLSRRLAFALDRAPSGREVAAAGAGVATV